MGRLLSALREMTVFYTPVTQDMRADLAWFQEFGRSWNGVAMIPNHVPTKSILVDACLTGIGGADDQLAYAACLAERGTRVANIAHLEAVNIVVAMHTLLKSTDKGGHIVIHCDNSAAVSVFQTGRGRDPFLLECARTAWMAQAIFQIQVTYKHIAGANNILADPLSRAYSSTSYDSLAKEIVRKYNLEWCDPCLHILDIVTPLFVHRSMTQQIGGQGGGQSADDKSTRHHHQQAVSRVKVSPVLSYTQHSPEQGQSSPHLYVYRGPGGPAAVPTHDYEPHCARKGPLHTGWAGSKPRQPRQSGPGSTGNKTTQRLLSKTVHPPVPYRAALSHGIYRRQNMYNLRAVISIMFYGGLRLSELLPSTLAAFDPLRSLTRADVWVADGKLKVRVKHAKNMQLYNQSRMVILSPSPSATLCLLAAVRLVLRHMPTKTPSQPMFVFPQSVRPVPASYARRRWTTVLKHLGMDPATHTMHSNRKTAATAAYDEGCLEPQIQNFGGWASKAYQTYICRDNQSLVNNVLVDSIHNS